MKKSVKFENDENDEMEEMEEYPAISKVLSILKVRLGDQISRKQSSIQHEIEENQQIVETNPSKIEPRITGRFHGISKKVHSFHLNQHSNFNHQNKNQQKKLILLQKVLQLCSDLQLKEFVLRKWKSHTSHHRQLHLKFTTILQNRLNSNSYALKFSSEVCLNCVRRFGKLRLSELFNRWRVCRIYFYQWIEWMNTRH